MHPTTVSPGKGTGLFRTFWDLEPPRVFRGKMEDLRRRVDPTHLRSMTDPDYEALMMSPLLRELVMGEPPLCHLINRDYRLKIRFCIARRPRLQEVLKDRPVFYARGDGLYPGSALPGSEIATLNLEKFLRETVMVIHGDPISVRDLIDYAANAAGAIHFGAKHKGKRALLAELDEKLRLGGLDATTKALIAIGRIVLDGLQPLVERLEKEQRAAA